MMLLAVQVALFAATPPVVAAEQPLPQSKARN